MALRMVHSGEPTEAQRCRDLSESHLLQLQSRGSRTISNTKTGWVIAGSTRGGRIRTHVSAGCIYRRSRAPGILAAAIVAAAPSGATSAKLQVGALQASVHLHILSYIVRIPSGEVFGFVFTDIVSKGRTPTIVVRKERTPTNVHTQC